MSCQATGKSAEVTSIVTRIQAVLGQPLQIPANCALLPAQDLMSACREAGLEIHGRQLDASCWNSAITKPWTRLVAGFMPRRFRPMAPTIQSREAKVVNSQFRPSPSSSAKSSMIARILSRRSGLSLRYAVSSRDSSGESSLPPEVAEKIRLSPLGPGRIGPSPVLSHFSPTPVSIIARAMICSGTPLVLQPLTTLPLVFSFLAKTDAEPRCSWIP